MIDVDLPQGYRWAEEHEMDRADAIVVTRTFDANGVEYTQGEADLAVPEDDDLPDPDVDCGHCIDPSDRCSDISDRNCSGLS